MKAIVCTTYGAPGVLQLQDIKKPVPRDNEILVEVHAATATAADSMMRRADPFISRFFLGLTRPRNAGMGTGFSGRVAAIGAEVVRFAVGDLVFGETGLSFGANAEYICMSEEGAVAPKPANMTHEEAAPLCDGAITALNFLKNLGHITAGQQVLINGASGGIGTSAVQLARHFGATVTGVCSTSNLALVKSLGAHRVIDYAERDFTHGDERYDIIFDTVGKRTFSQCKRALTPTGSYLSPVLGLGLLMQMLWTSTFGTKKAKFAATGMLPAAELRILLAELTELIEAGKLTTVIDKRYSLAQTAAAHRYVDTGRKRGNVVITVAPENDRNMSVAPATISSRVASALFPTAPPLRFVQGAARHVRD